MDVITTNEGKKVTEQIRINIFTEGGLKLGLGHIYRTLSLANQLKRYANIKFLTTSDDTVINKIKENNFEFFRGENIAEIENQLNLYKPQIVIIDKLEVEESFCRDIKQSFNPKIVIFGNISSANKSADIVINAAIGTDYKNKSYVDEDTGTLYLEGPKYLVLRDEFYEHKNSYEFKNDLKRILLIFGGSDQANLTSRVLNKLLSMDYDFKIDVVLGVKFGFHSELNQVLDKHERKKEKVNIYKDVNTISELILNSDLVITSLGTTMFESFCVGAPTIAFYQNPYQKNVMFKNFPMAFDFNEIENFEKFIFDFYNNYYENKKKIDALEVGMGKEEIIKSIMGGKK